MGKRGPSPKPTALRLLHGDRADRINTDEPTPRTGLPHCPDDASDEVRQVWDYTVAELQVMGLAFPADRDSLRCYCEAVVAHRRSSAVLAKSAILVKGIHGGMVRNPALQIQRDAAMTIRAFAGEFGLTPSARSTIRAQEAGRGREEDVNPFAGLAQ
ncbi:phage terminase small subunit P27 family [Lentzea sp. JNUCC 0626]|uniref:phage terminase small subunit P27 family n=1 Tax=Lentzea sp. JNUCC 0626 TaxID=3367513 RepID=UPI00374A9416